MHEHIEEASEAKELSVNDISEMSRSLIAAENKVFELENQLKAAKEAARIIREETIPGAMDELGIKSITLDSGEILKVVQDVYVSLTEANKPKVFEWLSTHGFGGLIKVEVSLRYKKGERDKALDFLKELKESGKDAEFKEDVHGQTMKAFLKEQINKGTEVEEENRVPLDLFGARPVSVAKISKK